MYGTVIMTITLGAYEDMEGKDDERASDAAYQKR